ncbi:hypothetical protein WJX72_005044 [[Myrmecia] bisecta]|uniref:AB hydrolase-1 domain-containing protein n=1 Tax=[Myrmecia] bisecta TaxID=41462 RepID=A0AAW1PNK6_9CHLO
MAPGSGQEIDLFVREAVAPNKVKAQLPFLLFLQGGPGFEAPRPTEASGWIKSATNHFRVILMDQRGTGRSSPITVANLARQGDAQAQADYLSHFRADNIVRDAELVRKLMVPLELQGGRWSVLGQSFGGFCAVQYLSAAPQGLTEVLLTGGLPPAIALPCGAETAYRCLLERARLQNRKYYQRFPADVELCQRIVRFLAAQPGGGARLPSMGLLTPRGFQILGLSGLGSGAGFERLHFLLEKAFDGSSAELSLAFLKGFEAHMPWDVNPLYAILHESIYCQGAASNWAAHRVLQEEASSDFDAVAAARSGLPVLFTGEMVFPWMFEEFSALRGMKDTAHLLASKQDWPQLYDVRTLERNAVPVASATYYEDLYVDFDLAQETASHINGIRQFITNEYMHSGIRDDGARIFDRLLGMVRGAVPLY